MTRPPTPKKRQYNEKKKAILDSTTKQKLQSQNGSIEFDWESDVDNGIIIKNTKLGVTIYYYAVFDTNNHFKYDTFGIAEREGNSVAVVLNQNNELCLLKEHRFMPDKYFFKLPKRFRGLSR